MSNPTRCARPFAGTVTLSTNALRTLRVIQQAGTCSRVGLAEGTGLSASSVHRAVSELWSAGAIVETRESTARQGRPSSAVSLNAGAVTAVGIDIGCHNTRVSIADWTGVILAIRTYRTPELGPDGTAQAALALIEESVRDGMARPCGIGVGVSGLVDPTGGLAVFCPNIPNWTGQDVVTLLSGRTGLGTVVDTSGRCLTLAEATFGVGRGVADQVTVAVGQGISAGVMVGGRLFRGSRGFSGEVGHVTAVTGGFACSCGNEGCLENYVTETMIYLHLQDKLRETKAHSILRDSCGDGVTVTGDSFRTALDAGDRLAYEHLVETGHLLGTGLANMANILDPELLVLGGGVIQLYPELVGEVRRTIKTKALNPIQGHMRVEASSMGWEGAAVGAALLAIQTAVFPAE